MEKLCREPMLEETPIPELSILSANQPTCSVPRYDSEPDEIIDRLSSSNTLFRTYEEYNMLAVLYEFEEERTPLILWNWFIESLLGCKVLRRCQFMDGYQISGLLSNFLCMYLASFPTFRKFQDDSRELPISSHCLFPSSNRSSNIYTSSSASPA
ncbi:uncharacterized protein RCO7_14175 [Rhynchosporium graminicola]|uniref:Uncharacterized protein n=1 Tax=Rhynchosporium graminicola TaxID=2792576 RepID=A0A1E1JWU9_9HELO|nr:uncharacterized protein RCO7_14175 [Rhynchosporium commune]